MNNLEDIFTKKEFLRKSVYDNLFKNGFSNRKNGDYGKIPDFKGSDIAALNLANTNQWKNAKTIFSSPVLIPCSSTKISILTTCSGK